MKNKLLILGMMLILLSFSANADITIEDPVYRSIPTIVVTFTDPVDATSILYSLKDSDGFSLGVTETTSQDNRIFVYEPAVELDPGTYTFSISAENIYELTEEETTTFTISYLDLDIDLIEPSFGVSATQITDFTIETGRSVDCKMLNFPIEPGLGEDFWDHPAGVDFDYVTLASPFIHTNYDYEIPGSSKELSVICYDDEIDVYFDKSFNLIYEETEPEIQSISTNYPNDLIVDYPPYDLYLYVTTNTNTICKYNDNEENLGFGEGEGFYVNTKYQKESEVKVRQVLLPVDTEKNYYVICKDQADRITDIDSITVGYEPDTDLEILSYNSPIYITGTRAMLNVTLNKQNAYCLYSGDYEETYHLMDQIEGGTQFSKLVSGLNQDRIYTFSVECADNANSENTDSVSIQVIRDDTAPAMQSVVLIPPSDIDDDTGTKTYYDDRIKVRMRAQENVSRVARFEYTVWQEFYTANEVIHSGAITSNIQDKGNNIWEWAGNIHNLELNDTEKYGMTVTAIDSSGLASEPMDSNNTLTVDRSLLPISCENGILDGTETGEDCGGECDGCPPGDPCDIDDDCSSINCGENDTCLEPTCDDEIENQDETDEDCGGEECDGCPVGDKCDSDEDCDSENCDAATGRCIPRENLCANGVLDNGEADIDCGGVCLQGCPPGDLCNYGSDCTSGVCSGGECQEPTCTDMVKNAQETDVDCGGTECPKCQDGRACIVNSDCLSDLCQVGVCTTEEEADGDGDGMNDDWERRNGLDPEDPSDANEDPDNDGLTNIMEFRLGTNPQKADTDGDGASDGEEYEKGTDPLDPNDSPGSPWFWIILLLVIIILLAVGGYFGYQEYQKGTFDKILGKKKKPSAMKPGARPGMPVRRPTRPVMRSGARPGMPVRRPMRPGMRPMSAAQRRRAEEAKKRHEMFGKFGEKKPAFVPIGEVGKKKEEEKKEVKSSDVFDKLSRLKTIKSESERKDVFDKLHNLAGEEVKPTHIRKVVKSDRTEISDKLKSLRMLAEKKLATDTNMEIKKHLEKLTKSHKQLRSQLKKVESKLKPESGQVIGTKKGSKFHKPHCIAVKMTPKENIVVFKDKKEAIKKGYKPCSICKP